MEGKISNKLFPGNLGQALTIGLLSFFYILFIISSFEYQSLVWFPWLFSSRIFMVILGIASVTYLALKRNAYANLDTLFVTIGIMFQASHGILEPSNKTDFYGYTGMLFILTALTYKGTWRQWLRSYLPVNFCFMAIPIFFKDHTIRDSISSFVDNFTLVIVGAAIGLIVSRINTAKNEAMQQNILLSKLLEKERDEQAEVIATQSDELSKAKTAQAIAKMVHMVAHDVRKPFNSLKMSLGILEKAESLEKVRLVLKALAPQIEKSVIAVNGMLGDIMEMGSKAEMLCENVPPEAMIGWSLNEVFSSRRLDAISFSYDFQHTHLAKVDKAKVIRVFNNIIDNAVDAVDGSGKIWFKTKDVFLNGSAHIQFCIGNDKSHIAEEDRGQIFDEFFTKGKKRGVGLGLAIAKRIVESHKGHIWCTSDKLIGTEFTFSLPADTTAPYNQSTSFLPLSSGDIDFTFDSEKAISKRKDILSVDKNVSENKMEQMIIDKYSKSGSKLNVLLIDDEPIVLDTLENLIGQKLLDVISVKKAKSSNEAFLIENETESDVIICDIDLGSGSLDGYGIVKRLRDSGSKATICIHSNSNTPGNYKTAMDVGSNSFIPKVIKREDLLAMML